MPNKNKVSLKIRQSINIFFLSLGVAALVFTFTLLASIDYSKVGLYFYPYSFILTFSYHDGINNSDFIARLSNIHDVESTTIVPAWDDVPDQYQYFSLHLTSPHQQDQNTLSSIQNILSDANSDASINGQAFERNVIRNGSTELLRFGIIAFGMLTLAGSIAFLNLAFRGLVSFKSGIIGGGIVCGIGLFLGVFVAFFIVVLNGWINPASIFTFTVPFLRVGIIGAALLGLSVASAFSASYTNIPPVG